MASSDVFKEKKRENECGQVQVEPALLTSFENKSNRSVRLRVREKDSCRDRHQHVPDAIIIKAAGRDIEAQLHESESANSTSRSQI